MLANINQQETSRFFTVVTNQVNVIRIVFCAEQMQHMLVNFLIVNNRVICCGFVVKRYGHFAHRADVHSTDPLDLELYLQIAS
jgi:hypothetical protein